MQQLKDLFKEYTGKSNPKVEALPSSGSNRRYYRSLKETHQLLAYTENREKKNCAFIELAAHFHEQH